MEDERLKSLNVLDFGEKVRVLKKVRRISELWRSLQRISIREKNQKVGCFDKRNMGIFWKMHWMDKEVRKVWVKADWSI